MFKEDGLGIACALLIMTLSAFILATAVIQGEYNSVLEECARENNIYACEWVAMPKEITDE